MLPHFDECPIVVLFQTISNILLKYITQCAIVYVSQTKENLMKKFEEYILISCLMLFIIVLSACGDKTHQEFTPIEHSLNMYQEGDYIDQTVLNQANDIALSQVSEGYCADIYHYYYYYNESQSGLLYHYEVRTECGLTKITMIKKWR